MLAGSGGPFEFGHDVGFLKSRVFSSVQGFEPVAAQLHEFKAVSPLAIPSTHQGVHLLVAEASCFEANAACHFGFRNGGRHEVECATCGLGPKGDLAASFANLHPFHTGHGGEVVGGRRRVRSRRHQHPIFHQGDARGTFRTGAAHPDVGTKAKPVLCHEVDPCQRMERANGVGVRHLPQRLGRQPLHGPGNFTRVGRSARQRDSPHLSFGKGVPHLGHDVQAVLGHRLLHPSIERVLSLSHCTQRQHP